MPTGVKRTGLASNRPLLAGVNPRATYKAMLDARLALYQEVATLVVQTDDLTVDAGGRRHRGRVGPGVSAVPPAAGQGTEPVTVQVASAAPYDVVIGRGLLDELVAAAVATGASRAALIHPPTLAATAEVIRDAVTGRRDRRPPVAGAGRRGRQEPHRARLLLERVRPDRARPAGRRHRAGRRFRHRRGRIRGRHLDARGRADPGAHHPAGHGRRRGRREDRHQHRRREEHGRRVLRAGRGDRRPGHPGDPAAARTGRRDGRGRQVRVHRRPGDPDHHRGRPGCGGRPARRRSSPNWSAGRWRSRPTWSPRTCGNPSCGKS